MSANPYRSEVWRERKRKFYLKYRRACAACGLTKPAHKIHLHHLNYDYKLGQEPDRTLIPLCSEHHIGAHRYASSVHEHYNLEEATAIYIRMVKAGKSPLRNPAKASYKKTLLAEKKEITGEESYRTKNRYRPQPKVSRRRRKLKKKIPAREQL